MMSEEAAVVLGSEGASYLPLLEQACKHFRGPATVLWLNTITLANCSQTPPQPYRRTGAKWLNAATGRRRPAYSGPAAGLLASLTLTARGTSSRSRRVAGARSKHVPILMTPSTGYRGRS
jgi:hypothetical protein